MALWLSKYVFYSKSLQVASRFITLANQLHHGRRVCISELLLASLYESIGVAVSKLKTYETGTDLLLAGPFWLLQLWLNATFESSLSTFGVINEEHPDVVNRSIEGTRLLKLIPNDDRENFRTCFTNYMMIFSKRHRFDSSMAPFATRSCGPNWFTMPLEEAIKE